jgi:hypothetical protein
VSSTATRSQTRPGPPAPDGSELGVELGIKPEPREPRRPSARALVDALQAHKRFLRRIRVRRYLTVIDYDLPYTVPRLFVLDILKSDGNKEGRRMVLQTRVSHAAASGDFYAVRFSNKPGSGISSRGSFLTARDTYHGRFGRSLRVIGLERGVNHNALKRAIIFHPAGLLTHSLGCFMIPDQDVDRVLDLIKGGSLVFVHASL